ncbi:MAG: hypothetical protein NE330_18035 [Lentisphaeraceae bacterium]|nr:hypothetical protein [Lentisphaeraceae bacterium]
MKISILVAFLMSSFFAFGQELNQDNNFYKIYEAAQQAKEKNVEGVKTLYKMSLEDFDNSKVNKMLIQTTLLAMIKGNSKAFKGYILAVDSKFIALEPMAFLGKSPFQVKCIKCKSQGYFELRCKDCNKGVCKNCKGKKKIVYKGLGGDVITKMCTTCKATGNCLPCNKTGILKQSCWTCVEKGTVFTRKAVPQEYEKSLQKIISYMPKYAAGKDILITDKMVSMAKQNLLKKELAEAKRKEKEQKEKELAALEAERKAARAKYIARQKELASAFSQDKKRSSRDENLDHVLLEFNQFFRNRERIQKQKVYEEATATYVKGLPTLQIVVSSSVGRLAKETKLQYLEAFYNFWKLRCTSNGLGRKVGYVAIYNKKDIAQVQNDEVVFN